MAADSLAARYYGTSIALVNTMGHIGAFSGPFVFGLVGSRFSDQAGLAALAAPSILGGAALFAASLVWERMASVASSPPVRL